MSSGICGELYDRDCGGVLRCTFRAGHHDHTEETPTPHSWRWAQVEDEEDRAARLLEQRLTDPTRPPADIDDVLSATS